jgi:transposase
MLSNAIRGHMAEFGLISAKGRNGTAELLKIIDNAQDDRLPEIARFSLDVLARRAWHRACEESRRLEEIPGIRPLVATALIAEVGDWKAFSSAALINLLT